MTTPNNEWIEIAKNIKLITIAKASLLLFVICLQIIAIVWLVRVMTNDAPAPITTTITETTTTTETTP